MVHKNIILQKIDYNKKFSKFKNIVSDILKKTDIKLLEQGLEITLPPNGYKGNYIIVIDEKKDFFYANSSLKDTSRFPARIKGAASALKSLGLWGEYRISHYNGKLIINLIK